MTDAPFLMQIRAAEAEAARRLAEAADDRRAELEAARADVRERLAQVRQEAEADKRHRLDEVLLRIVVAEEAARKAVALECDALRSGTGRRADTAVQAVAERIRQLCVDR